MTMKIWIIVRDILRWLMHYRKPLSASPMR